MPFRREIRKNSTKFLNARSFLAKKKARLPAPSPLGRYDLAGRFI